MIVTLTRDTITELVQKAGFGDELSDSDTAVLDALGFIENGDLTAAGRAYEEASLIYNDLEAAATLFRDALLGLAETQALLQGIQGRGPVSFAGAHHLMARHGLIDRGDATSFRSYLSVLNGAGIVSYSNKNQTVRGLAPVRAADEATLRVVEPERPYSNVLALREILRASDGYIWWAEVHMDRKVLEPLSYEADGSRIDAIRLLSGQTEATADLLSDLKRFCAEMRHRSITVEWRVLDKRDVDWHDRFIVAKNQVWNVPPTNTLFKGDYSELSRTSQRPPFETWWAKATPLEAWLAANQASA
jgi:hypothetical protein